MMQRSLLESPAQQRVGVVEEMSALASSVTPCQGGVVVVGVMDPNEAHLNGEPPMERRHATGDKISIAVCGRSMQIDAVFSMVALQEALQNGLSMYGQVFDVSDSYGLTLRTDLELREAIAHKRVPLSANLSEMSIHYMENRREELSQLQWKLVRDQLGGLSEKLQKFGNRVQELSDELHEQSRLKDCAIEQVRSDLVAHVEAEKALTRQSASQILERVDAVSHLLTKERNSREAQKQDFERRLQGHGDALEADRVLRQAQVASLHSLVDSLQNELQGELKDVKTSDERRAQQLMHMNERLDTFIKDRGDLVHDFSAQLQQFDRKMSNDLQEHSKRFLQVRSVMEGFEDEVRLRCQNLEICNDEIHGQLRDLALAPNSAKMGSESSLGNSNSVPCLGLSAHPQSKEVGPLFDVECGDGDTRDRTRASLGPRSTLTIAESLTASFRARSPGTSFDNVARAFRISTGSGRTLTPPMSSRGYMPRSSSIVRLASAREAKGMAPAMMVGHVSPVQRAMSSPLRATPSSVSPGQPSGLRKIQIDGSQNEPPLRPHSEQEQVLAADPVLQSQQQERQEALQMQQQSPTTAVPLRKPAQQNAVFAVPSRGGQVQTAMEKVGRRDWQGDASTVPAFARSLSPVNNAGRLATSAHSSSMATKGPLSPTGSSSVAGVGRPAVVSVADAPATPHAGRQVLSPRPAIRGSLGAMPSSSMCFSATPSGAGPNGGRIMARSLSPLRPQPVIGGPATSVARPFARGCIIR